MIHVTIELCSARTGKKSVLGTAEICNEGGLQGDTVRNYSVVLRDKAGRVWKQGRVEKFPRKRLLAWDLLCRSLDWLIGDRNPR